jgi:hypothetical protein
MASLITDEQKLAYGNVFNDMHDTFSRKIIVFKTPLRTVISTDINYNFLYGNNQDALKVEYTPVSGIFDARIKWFDPQVLQGYKEIKEEIHGNVCRLKIKKDARDFLDGSERVEIDGKYVQFFGSTQPHGLFDIDFYTMYFEESE